MSKGDFGSGVWCVVGDFNAVRRPEERRGVRESSSLNVEMREFDIFIEGLELNKLPLLGRRFTWYHANGVAMSRIDRGLISPEWKAFGVFVRCGLSERYFGSLSGYVEIW
jgi:hypothetical protein